MNDFRQRDFRGHVIQPEDCLSCVHCHRTTPNDFEFRKCPMCNEYVCEKTCWSGTLDMCKDCENNTALQASLT